MGRTWSVLWSVSTCLLGEVALPEEPGALVVLTLFPLPKHSLLNGAFLSPTPVLTFAFSILRTSVLPSLLNVPFFCN